MAVLKMNQHVAELEKNTTVLKDATPCYEIDLHTLRVVTKPQDQDLLDASGSTLTIVMDFYVNSILTPVTPVRRRIPVVSEENMFPAYLLLDDDETTESKASISITPSKRKECEKQNHSSSSKHGSKHGGSRQTQGKRKAKRYERYDRKAWRGEMPYQHWF